jgi:hypothetical protein
LGLELRGVDTVLNVDEGIKLLRDEFGTDERADEDELDFREELNSFGEPSHLA